ncbi:succinate dehydrogenase [Schaalia sp. 19OD2882]|uniref:succinate dehydrogenase n=1 Tax=Schaalia sp. 19OD2882 TaxID=2794089 RepID=UPI001C1ED4B7|nr:succinate dehydrogenase [Schaalia sp. 19OD2882]QWW18797.1 succinate dehydrogenase [Schaalia sp. 19OD2882]
MEIHGRLPVKRRKVLVPTWVAKALMAASGLMMALFVLVHMAGNLKLLHDPAAMDAYAAWLRHVGVPLLPDEGLLWAFRAVMGAALGVHLLCAAILWRRGLRTRTRGAKGMALRAWGARLMLPTGILLLGFVAVHILDLTVGALVASDTFRHPDPAHHAAANVVASLSRPVMAATYALALVALGVHLAHGLVLAWADLGGSSVKARRLVRTFAFLLALLVVAGDGAVLVHSHLQGVTP